MGTALALALHASGYPVIAVAGRASSRRRTVALARRMGAQARTIEEAPFGADIVWVCVPDDAIAESALQLAQAGDWRKRVVLHASGALESRVLQPLARRGAAVASLHPMMAFARGMERSFEGVPFGLEGDAAAARKARRIARDLGGTLFSIRAEDKPLYHMSGSFAAPLLLTTLAVGERIAAEAGIPRGRTREFLTPILRQVVENYVARGADASLTGPLVRGDLVTLRKHVLALRRVPEGREVYLALSRAAAQLFPLSKRKEVLRLLKEME